MTPRAVLPVRTRFVFILVAIALVGCGPDPAKQALLEQLFTTRSAITVGVTLITLHDPEIALRTAAALANERLNERQRDAVAAAIDVISRVRTFWSKVGPEPLEPKLVADEIAMLLDGCATRLDSAIALLR
jgi:hypothetical protein